MLEYEEETNTFIPIMVNYKHNNLYAAGVQPVIDIIKETQSRNGLIKNSNTIVL